MADVRSFEAAGLAAATPSGMREELLLVAWLIVLLRTREDGQVTYEWAYQGQSTVNTCLSTEVMADLRSTVGQTAEAIARNIAPPQETATSGLLLSTGALSQSSEEPKNEVSWRPPSG